MKPKTVLILIVLMFALSPPAGAANLYVPSQYLTIQDGITAAGVGDTVVVACGTYNEYDIAMKSGVWLRSDTRTYDCVTIDAQSLGRVFLCSGISSGSTVEGFTITGGLGFPGAGMDASNSDLTVKNCRFYNNSAVDNSGIVMMGGGGMYSTGAPTLTSCVFDSNSVSNTVGFGAFNLGGGLYMEGSATVTNCTFANNTAVHDVGLSQYGLGGGVYTDGSSVFTNCTISDNFAGQAGGMIAGPQYSGAVALIGCTFARNTSESTGGGLYAVGNPTLTSCAFDSNTASSSGGGVYMGDGTITLDDCTFTGNSAASYGGGLYAYSQTAVNATTCTFYGNSAGSGGGIYGDVVSATTLTGCTLSENQAFVGSGVYAAFFDTLTIDNTIIAFGTLGQAVYVEPVSSTTLTCTDIYGNAGGDWVGPIAGQLGSNGNITGDPLFCGIDNPDRPLTIYDSSPCAAYVNPTCGLIGAWDIECWEGDPPICFVTPDSLAFGTVLIGSSRDTVVTIKNIGGGTLFGNMTESCAGYSIVSGGGPFALAAGESLFVTVRFVPITEGAQACAIETGTFRCGDIPATGSGALITAITDVGNDQGGHVRLRFLRSPKDAPGSPTIITHYEVFRRDSLPPVDTWTLVGTVPAHGDPDYSLVTTTLGDSTAAGIYWSAYFVRVATTDTLTYFDCAPDSGYSVDNLIPNVPQGLRVAYSSGGNLLTWHPYGGDFQCFRVYRGSSPNFDTSPATLVHSTVEATWMDPATAGWGYHHYKVTAVDNAGNESPAAAPDAITGITGRSVPTRFALYQNLPNPFNPTTVIPYDVPAGGGRVTLKIFDVRGQLVVTLVDGVMTAGQKTALWKGTNRDGQRVASGVYFYKLQAPTYTKTLKMTLVQ